MSRPTFEVADIVQQQGERFVDRHRKWLSYQQLNVLRAIGRCRTSALGGHLDACPRCGHQAISFNSCRNRHCPKCQAQARQHWLTAREQELLDVSYFHVVLTLPHQRCFTICCSPRVPGHCSKSPLIQNTWAQRSGSSAFCIPGDRT